MNWASVYLFTVHIQFVEYLPSLLDCFRRHCRSATKRVSSGRRGAGRQILPEVGGGEGVGESELVKSERVRRGKRKCLDCLRLM